MQATDSSASQFLLKKVDSFLAAYPAYPYQKVFQDGALKTLLVSSIEDKLKQAMPMLNNPDKWQRLPFYLRQFVSLELRLESYLYWGIEYIIHNQFDRSQENIKFSRPSISIQDLKQVCIPSRWFG